MAEFEEGNPKDDTVGVFVDASQPKAMVYCPVCTMPPEFCEYGASFEKCLPWIKENCPEVLSEKVLAEMMGDLAVEDEGEEV